MPFDPFQFSYVLRLLVYTLYHGLFTGDTVSVMSEEGTLYGDDTSSVCGDWSPEGGDPMRDLLSRPPDPPPQSSPRPPPHAEVQLRYLLQVGKLKL